MRIGIIGAGMAGLACATALTRHGHGCVLFDKGRGPGGRMSTRRLPTSLGEASFDHGAQYLTARDPAFVAQVERWAGTGAETGRVARWPAAGADAWVGTPSMSAPVRAMADAAEVRWNTRIDAITPADGAWHLHGEGLDAERFDAAIVAVPAEQVPALIAAHDPVVDEQAQATRSDPCWTVMAAFEARVPVEQDRLTDLGIIASAVRNSAKPGRTGPEAWVLQASAGWSRDHLEDDAGTVERTILAAFASAVPTALPATIATSTHRWRYAKSGTLGRGAIWNADTRLGVCGDWLLGPRIEAAWLSGHRLAGLIG